MTQTYSLKTKCAEDLIALGWESLWAHHYGDKFLWNATKLPDDDYYPGAYDVQGHGIWLPTELEYATMDKNEV